MKIYLAGPMTGWKNYNKDNFILVADYLRKCGFEVVSPLELDELDGISTNSDIGEVVEKSKYNSFLKRDIKVIMDCNALVYMPFSENSNGVRKERQAAQLVDIPCYGLYALLAERALLRPYLVYRIELNYLRSRVSHD